MEELRTTQRRIEGKAFILGCLAFFIGLAFLGVKFSLGLMTGTLISILNFRLLAKMVIKSSTSKKLPFIFFIRSYLVRYILMGLVLWVAINKSLICFLGASAGLFMVKAAIYADNFLLPRRKCKTPA